MENSRYNNKAFNRDSQEATTTSNSLSEITIIKFIDNNIHSKLHVKFITKINNLPTCRDNSISNSNNKITQGITRISKHNSNMVNTNFTRIDLTRLIFKTIAITKGCLIRYNNSNMEIIMDTKQISVTNSSINSNRTNIIRTINNKTIIIIKIKTFMVDIKILIEDLRTLDNLNRTHITPISINKRRTKDQSQ